MAKTSKDTTTTTTTTSKVTLTEEQKNKLAILDGILKNINKNEGKGTISLYGSQEIEPIDVISTGSMLLDEALGVGGLPKGRIIEIFGPESSGKTTLTLHAIAECQKAGGIAAFIDAEHALDPIYAEALGVDMEHLIVSQPDNGEQALQILENLVKSGAVDLVVVDSVAALTPKVELEGDMDDLQVGLQARLMSKGLRKVTSMTNQTKTTVLFINQLRMKIGMTGYGGSPETTTGGNALKFYSSVRIDIRRIGSLKRTVGGEEEIYANKVKIKIVKNKVAAPFKVCETKIFFGSGFQKNSEVLDLAVKYNIVDKSGAWYSYDNSKLGQGEEKTLIFLSENKSILDEITKKTVEAMKEKSSKKAKKEIVEASSTEDEAEIDS